MCKNMLKMKKKKKKGKNMLKDRYIIKAGIL